MKKRLFLWGIMLCFAAGAQAQQNCRVQDELPLQLMQSEIKRGMNKFKKLHPSVYYMSYVYEEPEVYYTVVAHLGDIVSQTSDPGQPTLWTRMRAGSPKMDNTRQLKGESSCDDIWAATTPRPTAENTRAFKVYLWDMADHLAEDAQKCFSTVQTNSQQMAKRMDESDDFVFPPKETYCRTQAPVLFDEKPIEKMVVNASAMVKGNKTITGSRVSFGFLQGHRYFVDSQGTQLKTPVLRGRLMYDLYAFLPDGTVLSRSNSYDVLDPAQLPSEEKLYADVKQSIREIEELAKAPEAEPITVPVLLKNRAMAVFVHEVLGHRLEGHRQKQDSFGRTFTDKIGQPITAPFITIMDDPTLRTFKGVPLRGFYEYDDEGVKSQPVTLVEEGVLKNFLMGSSPIKGFPVSNGHGRTAGGMRSLSVKPPVARMGNTRLIASQSVSYEELEQKLLDEIRSQGKPYGYIIEDLSGGFTMTYTSMPQVFKLEPKWVYRMYPDGRKEVVRGVDLAGTPLVSFGQILAAADDDDVFNGNCGAESGWVPVSSISPSVLLRALEIEKTEKSNEKPEILPAPHTLPNGGRK